jgi:hypothetical protein
MHGGQFYEKRRLGVDAEYVSKYHLLQGQQNSPKDENVFCTSVRHAKNDISDLVTVLVGGKCSSVRTKRIWNCPLSLRGHMLLQEILRACS